MNCSARRCEGTFLRPLYLVPHRLTPAERHRASASSPTSERSCGLTRQRDRRLARRRARSRCRTIIDGKTGAQPRCVKANGPLPSTFLVTITTEDIDASRTFLTSDSDCNASVVGCNKAEPPAKVQEDVAKATDSATANMRRAADKLASAMRARPRLCQRAGEGRREAKTDPPAIGHNTG